MTHKVGVAYVELPLALPSVSEMQMNGYRRAMSIKTPVWLVLIIHVIVAWDKVTSISAS